MDVQNCRQLRAVLARLDSDPDTAMGERERDRATGGDRGAHQRSFAPGHAR